MTQQVKAIVMQIWPHKCGSYSPHKGRRRETTLPSCPPISVACTLLHSHTHPLRTHVIYAYMYIFIRTCTYTHIYIKASLIGIKMDFFYFAHYQLSNIKQWLSPLKDFYNFFKTQATENVPFIQEQSC